MKKFCLIGGLGPEATVDYYRLIISNYQSIHGVEESPEIIVISLNVNKLLTMVEKCAYEEVIDYLLTGINQGYSAGAEFAAIGANTPHIVFDELKKVSPIPLISIIESTAKHASELEIKKIALLGTKFTMEEDFFKNVLIDYNVTPILPSDDEQEYIHSKIMNELEVGIVNSETKKEFLKIVDRMIVEDEIDGLILGCTELPLLLSQEDDERISFLNTIDIHVSDIVDYMK